MGLAYRFRGLVHYHQGTKHGRVPAGMALEREMKVLFPGCFQNKTESHSPYLGLHSDILPPTRPQLTIAPLPEPRIFKHRSLGGPNPFKPLQKASLMLKRV